MKSEVWFYFLIMNSLLIYHSQPPMFCRKSLATNCQHAAKNHCRHIADMLLKLCQDGLIKEARTVEWAPHLSVCLRLQLPVLYPTNFSISSLEMELQWTAITC